MKTRFHVPTRVFGSRRVRDDRSTDELESLAVTAIPAALTGTDPVVIDPMLNDRPHRSSSYLLQGESTVLIDPGSARAAPAIIAALDSRNIKVDRILLTHIHADAAAGAGLISARFPQAGITAPVGTAERLADPGAMVSDMKKVYGESVEKLHGLPSPIDPARIRTVEDGDRIELGDRTLLAIATPGHTAAHMSYFDPAGGSLFCGDALGIQLPGSNVVRPSTPPWDFSFEDSLESIGKLSAVGADTIYLAHFGAAEPGPAGIFNRAVDSLERWHDSFLTKREQTENDEDLSRQFNACIEASLEPVSPAVRRDLEEVSPAWLNLAGLNAEQARLRRRLSDAA